MYNVAQGKKAVSIFWILFFSIRNIFIDGGVSSSKLEINTWSLQHIEIEDTEELAHQVAGHTQTGNYIAQLIPELT